MSASRVSDARERVLQVAEALFSERGYTSVTLRDIAGALDMRQASLYYHVPGGKQALFVEVTERGLNRHRAGLTQAILGAGSDLRAQLRSAARWLLSQPRLNFGRMLQSDMPAVGESEAARLGARAMQSLIEPVADAFARVLPDTPERRTRSIYLAGAFLSIVEGIHNLPDQYARQPRDAMADYLIDVVIDGLRPHRTG